jgi:hypothetical protein
MAWYSGDVYQQQHRHDREAVVAEVAVEVGDMQVGQQIDGAFRVLRQRGEGEADDKRGGDDCGFQFHWKLLSTSFI